MWAASCLASCCAACACEACRSVAGSISRRSARIAYCGLFALSLVVSWGLREVAAPLMESLPCKPLTLRPSRPKSWFQTDAVLRVSLGNFVFFTILAVIMIGIKNQKDPRDQLHHGSEKPLLPFDKLDEQEDKKTDEAKPVSYSYTFFHLIFSLASMYSAMLLTGWSTSVGESGKLIDVGWPSVWVRIVTGWATAALFIWSLVAPLIFPDREF
ncbi:hypothetical protein GW17_00036330 [Ensete ventricosum]|nr:hypothetical protein GW17_00036330 [Ensete ventricosum]